MRVSLIHENAFSAPVATVPMKLVRAGLILSTMLIPPDTRAASRFPQAPSIVCVDVAASLATSVMPRSITAALNSSAVISPFSMASRKLPV